MTNPEISIVVPVYNTEKYLTECLESILNQTYESFEVLCVNDGSTDSSLEILERYARKDKRIKIFSHENQGLSVTRNVALENVKGQYVLFVDSDDYIHPKLLETAYRFAKSTEADIVNFGFEYVPEDEKRAFKDEEVTEYKITKNPLEYLLKKKSNYTIPLNVWNKLYKFDYIKNMRFIKGIKFEDVPYTAGVLKGNPLTVLLPNILYFYRDVKTSLMKQPFDKKDINSYHIGLNDVYLNYKTASKKEWKCIRKILFPAMYTMQLKGIRKQNNQPELVYGFAVELADLDSKGCLKLRGNKIKRYLKYKQLVKRGKK